MLSIEEIKRRIVPICEKHGILKAVLFGSYARNEATNESDVDFQITLQRGSGLLKLYAINSEFETALGTKVDFITKIPKKRGLLYEKRFRENLEKDGIVLYEGS
ncbi:MAG: nucleotidyltransferase domain-containing protein [Schwartzia sp.]|nr:nucleotidyltransferase domain-containing protein [Schwartzia sp. (in: firmicutes)]